MVLNIKPISKILCFVTAVVGVSMLAPLLVALYYGETSVAKCFGLWGAVCVVLGLAGVFLLPKADNNTLRARDGFFVTSSSWILIALLGAVPFMLTGTMTNYVDAFFEAASGFTTTGATLLKDVEALSHGMLFWRSFIHWLGGMGFLLLTIVLLPVFGKGSRSMVRAESTGPITESTDFSFREASKKLYAIYIIISLLLFIALLVCGLSPFDAAIHTFGTMGTGGYSNYNASIGAFNSPWVDIIISIFMIVCSMNFNLIYMFFHKQKRKVVRDQELRLFLTVVVCATVFMAAVLYAEGYYSLPDSFRYSLFQTASIASSTGYATADVKTWPVPCYMVLFILMIGGGCASSTSGGMKSIRVLILGKIVKRSYMRRKHPNISYPVKLGDTTLTDSVVSGVLSFSALYLSCAVAGTMLLCIDGESFSTCLGTAISSLSNIGMCSGEFSWFGKLVCVALMIMGRLEFFNIMTVFTPSFWDAKK